MEDENRAGPEPEKIDAYTIRQLFPGTHILEAPLGTPPACALPPKEATCTRVPVSLIFNPGERIHPDDCAAYLKAQGKAMAEAEAAKNMSPEGMQRQNPPFNILDLWDGRTLRGRNLRNFLKGN